MSTTVITVALLQNSIDLVSIKRGSHSGMGATSSELGREVIRVQLDGVTEETVGEDCEPTTLFMRTDPGVRNMPVECLVCFIGIQNYLSLYKSILVKQQFDPGEWFCQVAMRR